jgi:hypothetical protein
MQLTIRGRIESPTAHEWVRERIFSSPLGSWTARFHHPVEWHMGADGWRLSLIHRGWDVTWRHRHVKAMRGTKGFALPAQYQPWCSSQPLIALQPWDNVVQLYDIDERRSTELPIQLPFGLQWAPVGGKLAVTVEGAVRILDTKGSGFDVPTSHSRSQYPDVFWWPDGNSFFVVNRTSSETKTTLSFFDATNGTLLASEGFDPSDFVPYDESAYRHISRAECSLQIGRGTRAAGFLLDTWSSVEFDLATRLLRAMVYRPVGPCEKAYGQYTCLAEERGVEVAVSI